MTTKIPPHANSLLHFLMKCYRVMSSLLITFWKIYCCVIKKILKIGQFDKFWLSNWLIDICGLMFYGPPDKSIPCVCNIHRPMYSCIIFACLQNDNSRPGRWRSHERGFVTSGIQTPIEDKKFPMTISCSYYNKACTFMSVCLLYRFSMSKVLCILYHETLFFDLKIHQNAFGGRCLQGSAGNSQHSQTTAG